MNKYGIIIGSALIAPKPIFEYADQAPCLKEDAPSCMVGMYVRLFSNSGLSKDCYQKSMQKRKHIENPTMTRSLNMILISFTIQIL